MAILQDSVPPERMIVGTRYGRRVLVPSNQLLDPAGQRIEFPGRPVDLALSPDGGMLAVLLPSGIQIFSPEGQKLRFIPAATASIAGLTFTPDGERIAASTLGSRGVHSVTLADVKGSGATSQLRMPRNAEPTGLAFDPAGKYLYVALNRLNTLGRVDLGTGELAGEVEVGVAPISIALTPKADRIFVANWGGRPPALTQRSAISAGTRTSVDERGVASSGSVSVVDLKTFRVIEEIAVGLHPGSIRISPDGKIAAVANANSDSVSLLDTASLKVLDTVSIPAWPKGYLGSSPTALAFGAGGRWLYVACAGINAVAVLEREETTYRLRGYVPTDWYPVGLAVRGAPAGETVYVANSKGVGSRDAQANFTVHQALGTINSFPGATAAAAQQAVIDSNDPFRDAGIPKDSPADLAKLGIRHVYLIIKENRTYDQILGDLERGNGEPKLTLYGKQVTPNHHALASQFVTLDNFFASGVVSADGHQWLTQATASDYIERSHASYPRSYPYQGEDPLAFAASGFLWNQAVKAGLTVRVFGEAVVPAPGGYPHSWTAYYQDALAPQMTLPARSVALINSLNGLFDPSFPAFALNIPDVFRARLLMGKLKAYSESQTTPNLVIVQLPTNHTQGTMPGFPTPRAMVADNDLALGVIVQAITESPEWPKSAIFVVEDDAQNGVDHVDGHRTVCLVISPYTRRGVVDSTHYNQTSVLRTIADLLGMAPMNKFDAAALPMRSVFQVQANLQPYRSVPNVIPLDEMNPAAPALRGAARRAALDSMAMDFSRPDAVPEQRLNRILWHTARGWTTPYPRVPHRPECVVDDDDR